MRYSLVLLLLLTSCTTIESITKSEQLATTDEVAKIRVKPNLDLPVELDLDKYKLDETKVKQYNENGKVYIGIPEEDMLNQQEFLLVLKNRIKELQRIILDAKKLM
jgi:hypothetical protein